jgi:dihydrofolate reductase
VFVIGGAGLYAEAFHSLWCEYVLLTTILTEVECDTFVPLVSQMSTYQRLPHSDLETLVGFDVPQGIQHEKDMAYEFQLYKHCP